MVVFHAEGSCYNLEDKCNNSPMHDYGSVLLKILPDKITTK